MCICKYFFMYVILYIFNFLDTCSSDLSTWGLFVFGVFSTNCFLCSRTLSSLCGMSLMALITYIIGVLFMDEHWMNRLFSPKLHSSM